MAGQAAFRLPTEGEEMDELQALTGALEKPTGDADLDAVASQALGIMAREEREIERYRQAMNLEIERIQTRYSRLAAPHVKRFDEANGLALECARRATFPGKAKSRKVGNGRYGMKQTPEKVEVKDEAALLTWLRVADPSVIKTVTNEKVYMQDLKPAVLGHLKVTGEVPPGVEHYEAKDEPFAKPLTEEE